MSDIARDRLAESRLDALRGALAALALALAALPPFASPLYGLFEPELAATGIAAFVALGALALAARRLIGVDAPLLAPLAVFAAVTLCSREFRAPSDTLHADRATLMALAGFGFAVAGATLGPRARRTFLATAMLASLGLVAVALADRERDLRGALGNTGATSEAALAGAVIGATYFARGAGLMRVLGLAALALDAWYTGRAPVFAGAAALGLALVAALIADAGQRVRYGIALALAAALFAGARATALHERGAGAATNVAAAPSSDLGGVAVRTHIWARLPAYWRDYGALGSGPGQFAATFPRYRDPAEIAAERRALGGFTEVEHAHSDPLQALCEGGWLGGGAWLVFGAAIAVAALRRLREAQIELTAAALGTLALTLNSLVRAPLSWNAISASAFFVLAGITAARERATPRRSPLARAIPWLALAPLVFYAGAAWSLAAHAQALAVDRPGGTIDLERALALRNDSASAWSLRALQAAAHQSPGDERAALERVLALRPESASAHLELGALLVQADALTEARAHLDRARALDPENPQLALPSVELALECDAPEELERALAAHAADLPRDALRSLALRAWLEGRDPTAKLVDTIEPGLGARTGVELEARAAEFAKAGDALAADAFECRANQLFAREDEHANGQHNAVRLYRQAVRLSKTRLGDRLTPLRVEYAAALVLDDKVDDARRELSGATPSLALVAAREPWVGEVLFAHGLIGR